MANEICPQTVCDCGRRKEACHLQCDTCHEREQTWLHAIIEAWTHESNNRGEQKFSTSFINNWGEFGAPLMSPVTQHPHDLGEETGNQ